MIHDECSMRCVFLQLHKKHFLINFFCFGWKHYDSWTLLTHLNDQFQFFYEHAISGLKDITGFYSRNYISELSMKIADNLHQVK